MFARTKNDMGQGYTKAIEQLGSDNIIIRLGGIYALERIAQESERYYLTIIEVLTAFVRENAPNEQKNQEKTFTKIIIPISDRNIEDEAAKPRTDIQAALTVIGRRNRKHEQKNKWFGEYQWINLRNTNLAGADFGSYDWQGVRFEQANLQGADFRYAKLQQASLWRANLQKASLEGAKLQEADLLGANLQEANLFSAQLQAARLCEVNLQGATLTGANLQKALLTDANLQGALLAQANLQDALLFGANLQDAILLGANLKGTNLCRANLQGVESYLRDEIESAQGDRETVLPADLTRPAHWMRVD